MTFLEIRNICNVFRRLPSLIVSVLFLKKSKCKPHLRNLDTNFVGFKCSVSVLFCVVTNYRHARSGHKVNGLLKNSSNNILVHILPNVSAACICYTMCTHLFRSECLRRRQLYTCKCNRSQYRHKFQSSGKGYCCIDRHLEGKRTTLQTRHIYCNNKSCVSSDSVSYYEIDMNKYTIINHAGRWGGEYRLMGVHHITNLQ